MKYLKSLVLLLPGILLTMCSQKLQTVEVEIEHELSDDVSPVNVVLKIDEPVHYAEWIVNDTMVYHTPGKNSIDLVFEKTGVTKVELKATNANGDGFYGNTQIDIPPIASKLLFKGFYFEKDPGYEFTSDSLKVEINYFNNIEIESFNYNTINSSLENKNPIMFDNPFVVDITGFEKAEIRHIISAYIFDSENHELYFRSTFNLNDAYFHERLILPERLTKYNILEQDNDNKITLLVDWLR